MVVVFTTLSVTWPTSWSWRTYLPTSSDKYTVFKFILHFL